MARGRGRTGGRGRRRTEEVVRRRSRHLENVKRVNPSEYDLLRQFVTEHGKIMPARLTGASAKQQRQIKRGVRRARVMGILA